MLRGATKPVRMPCVGVCLCVEIFFPTKPYVQAGLTDLDVFSLLVFNVPFQHK